MDYGGHDQVFNDNVIYVRDSDGQNCFNQGSYLEGHGIEYVKIPQSYLQQHILTFFVLSIIGFLPLGLSSIRMAHEQVRIALFHSLLFFARHV